MNRLIEEASKYVGCGYALSGQGEILTAELLEKWKRINGIDHYVFTDGSGERVDAAKWIGRRVFDCSGLIVYCMHQIGVLDKSIDYTAALIYSRLCDPITKVDLIPGDLVFSYDEGKQYISHVGIYIGDGQVIESKGTKYGVIIGPLRTVFDRFGKLKIQIPESRAVPQWKSGGEQYLFDKGYIQSRHDPLEPVDIGTLGTILRNIDNQK